MLNNSKWILRRSKIHLALNLIVEVKNSSQQNGRYMLPIFFRESLHAHTTIKGSLPYNEKNIFLNSNFIFNFVSTYFNHVNYV